MSQLIDEYPLISSSVIQSAFLGSVAVLLYLSKCVILENFRSRMIENYKGCSDLLAIMGKTSHDIMLAFEINPEK